MAIDDFGPAVGRTRLKQAAADFAASGFVRLENVLPKRTAQRMHAWLRDEAEWWRVLNQGDKVWDLGPESIAALDADPAKAGQLREAINAGARDGFQYAYDTVRVADQPAERKQRQWPVDQFLEAINSDPWLELFRRVTGEDAIALADGQATRYLPEHFLTAHDDEVAGKHRHAAYVLGLTPAWQTHWGGLLMFHADNGDVEQALMPRFNAMNLFRVPRLHSVSPVAPYAGGARFSVTGWLRSNG